jgi:hypothetical protein
MAGTPAKASLEAGEEAHFHCELRHTNGRARLLTATQGGLLLAVLVHPNLSLAQVFYLIACIATGVAVVCGLLKEPVPFAGVLVPFAIFFVALGLFFSF